MRKRLVVLGAGGATLDPERVARLLGVESGDALALLPFAASPAMVAALADLLGRAGGHAGVLAPGSGMEAAALAVREPFMDMVADAGRIRLGRRTLRERLEVPGGSSWWWSLFSEKSTLKTAHFQQLVRLKVVADAARSFGANEIILAGRAPLLAEALGRSPALSGVAVAELEPGRPKSLPAHLKACLAGARDHVRLGRRVRRETGPRGLTPHATANLLCVTYYPKFDKAEAAEGRFVTGYYARLQQALEKAGKRISWVALYVPSPDSTLTEALAAARSFREHGAEFCFPEHYLGPRDYAACGAAHLGALAVALRAEPRLRELCRLHEPRLAWWPIVRDLWRESFAGYHGLWTRLMHRAFGATAEACGADRLFYTFENQAWERAMLAGVRAARPGMRANGYQAQTISRLELSFFNRPDELRGGEPLPLPDKVVCNGPYIRDCLMESGIGPDRLPVAEAVNYGHLFAAVRGPWREDREFATVMGTINADETAAIVSLCVAAFSGPERARVRFRPHPFCGIGAVCERLGLPPERFPLEPATGPLSDVLAESAAAIGCGSTAMVEAVAHGCRAIDCANPAWFNLSPLFGQSSPLVFSAATPEELRTHVLGAFERRGRADAKTLRAEAERVVRYHFTPEDGPAGPERLLAIVLGPEDATLRQQCGGD